MAASPPVPSASAHPSAPVVELPSDPRPLPGRTSCGHHGRPAHSVTIHICSTSRRLGPPGFRRRLDPDPASVVVRGVVGLVPATLPAVMVFDHCSIPRWAQHPYPLGRVEPSHLSVQAAPDAQVAPVRFPPPNDLAGVEDMARVRSNRQSNAGPCSSISPGRHPSSTSTGAPVAASSMWRASRATPIMMSLRPSSLIFSARSSGRASVDTHPTMPRASPIRTRRRVGERSHQSRRRWRLCPSASSSATRRRSCSANGATASPIARSSPAASAKPWRDPRKSTRSHWSIAAWYLWKGFSSTTCGFSAWQDAIMSTGGCDWPDEAGATRNPQADGCELTACAVDSLRR